MKIKYSHRPPTAPMGRFGGGWQINVGIQASRSTVIFNLFVASVRIELRPVKP